MTRTPVSRCAPRSSEAGHPLIDADQVRVAFGPSAALDEVSITVGSGESIAVVGSSGSGKSTLLHCLAGLRVPDGGSIRVDGRELTAMSDLERSTLRLGRFGIVFQFGELVPELSVLDNVALPAWFGGMARKPAQAEAARLLEMFAISHVADRSPGEISGGERQRAAVARALVHQPDVVFADEPTGALDSVNADNVIAALLEGCRARGAAVVLVTHERRFADATDRVVELSDGRVVNGAGRM